MIRHEATEATEGIIGSQVDGSQPNEDEDDEDEDDYSNGSRYQGSLMREFVLKYVGYRRCKVFHEIYHDVLEDYGSVDERSVYRWLAKLVDEREIVNVAPPGRSKKGRPLPGGYVRSDSPLLWETDGYSTLIDSMNDS